MSKRPWWLTAGALTTSDLAAVGGKARGLYHLTASRFAVPGWGVLTTEAFRSYLEPFRCSLEAVLANADTKSLPGCDAAARALNAILPGDTADSMLDPALARALDDVGPGPLAVRSSATIEDGALHSFAGQFDTVLGVVGALELKQAVFDVWRSTFSARSLFARARLGRLTIGDVAMAVVIQRQVPATVSGVIHSVNVAGQKLDEYFVGAVSGAGEALVSGEVSGQTFVKSRRTGEGRRIDAGADPDLLGAAEMDALCDQARAAEALMGSPQDVEYAFSGTALWILQSRTLTLLEGTFPVDPSSRDDLQLWDNSNIAESYAGVTSPLTFSFLRASYANVYREAGQILGLAAADVLANEPYYRQLLGYHRGRVFYNLRHWYQLALQLPGGDRNARDMETMMGVSERLPDDRARVPGPARQLVYALQMIRLYHQAPGHVRHFRDLFEDLHRKYRARLKETLSFSSLVATYRQLEADLKGEWAAPILADLFAMIFFGVTRKMAKGWHLEDQEPVLNALLARNLSSPSAKPVLALARIARDVRSNPAWKEAVLETSVDGLVTRLGNDPALAGLALLIDEYLDEFGDRFVGELKLEEPPLRENPRWILSLLAAQVASAQDTSSLMPDPTSAQRALQQAAGARLGWFARRVLSWSVNATRRFIGYRETMRFDRSRLFGLARDLFRRMGTSLCAAGNLEDPQDVFFLTVEEVLGHAEGLGASVDLAGLARVRRKQWEAERDGPPPPDRFWTVGAPGAWTPLIPAPPTAAAGTLAPRSDELVGTACSPGHVEGIVQVVDDPLRPGDLAGKILVARSNDPGWVPLYAQIVGLLLERGSALSHAANIARELGLPAVLGVPGLTARLRTGMRVAVDASNGRIRILDEDPEISADSQQGQSRQD